MRPTLRTKHRRAVAAKKSSDEVVGKVSAKAAITVENDEKTIRPVLGDKTNNVFSPSAEKIMSLRKRDKKVYRAADPTDSCSSPTPFITPFKHGVVRSSRLTASNKTFCSTRKISKSNASSLSDCFVSLEDDAEQASSQGSGATAKKTCVYKTEEPNLMKDMLPEEKLKLYEFEVDENEPKQVKNKRKRKPKSRKRKIVVSETCDKDNVFVKSAVKRLCDLTTSSTTKEQSISSIPSICVQPEIKSNKGKENCRAPKSADINCTEESMLSPILISENSRVCPISATLKISLDNNPASSSTPQTPLPTRRRMALTPRFLRNIASSPSNNTHMYNRVMPSIFVRPTMDIEHNFSLELPEIDSSFAIDPNVPDGDGKISRTPRNDKENPPTSAVQHLRQSKIHSFFDPNEKVCDGSVEKTKSDVNGSGLCDEMPSCAKSLTKESDCSVNNYVTVRRRFIESLLPRVSLDPREPDSEFEKSLTIDNCFGFDDGDTADEAHSSPTPVREQLKLKSASGASSTPSERPVTGNRSGPVRFSPRQLKKVLAPLVAKKPVVPILSKPLSAMPYTDDHLPVTVSCPITDSNSCSYSNKTPQSPSVLFTDSKILTPVSFAEDGLSSSFIKPARRSYQRPARLKRSYYSDDEDKVSVDEHDQIVAKKKSKKKPREYKKKEMKEVADWVSSMNAQFEEIEDMELCVE